MLRSVVTHLPTLAVVIAVAAVGVFPSGVLALPPQVPDLPQAPSLETRVTSLESRMAAVEAKCGIAPPVQPTVYKQVGNKTYVCTDSGCTLVSRSGSAQSTPIATASNPCPVGICGNDCPCPLNGCPVSCPALNAVAYTTVPSYNYGTTTGFSAPTVGYYSNWTVPQTSYGVRYTTFSAPSNVYAVPDGSAVYRGRRGMFGQVRSRGKLFGGGGCCD